MTNSARKDTAREYRPVGTDDYLDALVLCFAYESAFASFWHSAEKSQAWGTLKTYGDRAVAPLLRGLRDGRGGMHFIHALHELTQAAPDADAHAPVAPGWVGTNVDQAVAAWLEWGKGRV